MSNVQMAEPSRFIYSFELYQMQAMPLHAAITATQPNVPMNNKSYHKQI